jgi:hypothetical protein
LSRLSTSVCGWYIAVIPLFSLYSPAVFSLFNPTVFRPNPSSIKGLRISSISARARRLYDPLRFADKDG